MRFVHDLLRSRLMARVTGPVGHARESLDELRAGQWSETFERLMRNRLMMGRFRYGALQRQQKGEYANVASAIQRLRLYQRTGNQEHLVDAANLCLVEFVNGAHPQAHFNAADDGVHTARS